MDANDVSGRLDIKSVSRTPARVTGSCTRSGHSVPGAVGAIGPRTPNFFLLDISVDGDFAPERSVSRPLDRARSHGRALHEPQLDGARPPFASRPDAAQTSRCRSRRRGSGTRRRTMTGSAFLLKAAGACATLAARTGRRTTTSSTTSALRPSPSRSRSSRDRSSTTSTSPSRTRAAPGSRAGKLQHRLAIASTTWTTIETRSTSGAQTARSLRATAGAHDQFRVVAVDNHGNRRVSPPRRRSTSSPPRLPVGSARGARARGSRLRRHRLDRRHRARDRPDARGRGRRSSSPAAIPIGSRRPRARSAPRSASPATCRRPRRPAS